MKLYLIRHGESLGNVDGNVYFHMKDSEIPLTAKGESQARAVGDRLASLVEDRPFRILHSPYLRAKNTATLIDSQFILHGKYGQMHEDVLLYERGWGDLRHIVESEKFDSDSHFDFFYRPLGGESYADVYVRVVTFFNSLKADSSREDAIIVSHNDWIQLALMYLRGYSVKYFSKNRGILENCGCIIAEM